MCCREQVSFCTISPASALGVSSAPESVGLAMRPSGETALGQLSRHPSSGSKQPSSGPKEVISDLGSDEGALKDDERDERDLDKLKHAATCRRRPSSGPKEVIVDLSSDEGALKDDEKDERDLDKLKHVATRKRRLRLRTVHTSDLPHWFRSLRRLIACPQWESFWAVVILINVSCMIAEEEYRGIRKGHDIGWYEHYGSEEYSERWWPNAITSFTIVEFAFATLFSLELVITFSYDLLCLLFASPCVFRKPFWRDIWDLIDAVVVVVSDVTLFGDFIDTPFNFQLLRILRLAKLLRLLKLLRKFQSFDPMMMITTALQGSLGAQTAAFGLLFVILTLPAMALTNVLRSWYLEDYRSLTPEKEQELFMYFGTYSRAVVSMLELALANWPTITRFMIEDLHEGFGLFCVLFKITVGFAVINVINGVFIKACFTAAENDDHILVRNRMQQVLQHKARMTRFFEYADKDCDGVLTREEFSCVLQRKAIRTWLEAMDLRFSDPNLLFDLLADADGGVTMDSLVKGVANLRGPARNIALVSLRSSSRLESGLQLASPTS